MDDWTKKALREALQAWAGVLLLGFGAWLLLGLPGLCLGAGVAMMMSGLDRVGQMRAEAMERRLEEIRDEARRTRIGAGT